METGHLLPIVLILATSCYQLIIGNMGRLARCPGFTPPHITVPLASQILVPPIPTAWLDAKQEVEM